MQKKTILLILISTSFCIYQNNNFTNENKSVHDFSNVYHETVDSIEFPKTIAELRDIIIKADKPIAVAGGKYSMGGQVWFKDGVVVDMQHLNAITAFNPEEKTISVQAGACWSDLQEFLHSYNLSIMVMQSYNDFSIGGSLSVNIHGRDPHGQVITTVESIMVMLADGSLVQASRTENSDIFNAVIGGYGACGIIVNVTLHLEENYKIKRCMKTVSVNHFTNFYKSIIATNQNISLFNANLYGPHYDKVVAVSWEKTDKALTSKKLALQYNDNSNLFLDYQNIMLEHAISEYSLAQRIRYVLDTKVTKNKNYVVWRSNEMSYSVKSLAASSDNVSKILQEYFIPVDQFNRFVETLKETINDNKIKMLNISIRHVPANNESLLTYAPQDCFAFVCYISIKNNPQGHENAKVWTQKLINAALDLEGTYYLPYHLFATKDQFIQAYPGCIDLLKIKSIYDPTNKFQNSMTQSWKYLS